MARVCADSTYFDVDGSGLLTFKPESVGIQQLLVFDTVGSTSFTKASFPGLLRVRVRVIGGGGGAGGAQASPAGTSVAREGASGGGYSESLLNASALGASESVVVGTGGAGGVGNNSGGTGGTSSFGGFVIALGGFGGGLGMPLGSSEWTAPGTPQNGLGTGQIRTAGEPGGQAKRAAIDGTCQGLAGGGSGGGYGAGGVGRVQQTDGAAGTGYGGGGSGAISFGAIQTGGAGSRGAVILELFY